MCKEVDNDSNDSNNSSKVTTRDVKILPVTENPVTIPQNNQFSPPKHKTSYVNNGIKINNDEIDDISFSSLEESNNHVTNNQPNSTNNKSSSSTEYKSNSSSESISSQKSEAKSQKKNSSNSEITPKNSKVSSNDYSTSNSYSENEEDASTSE